jgi:hypothetical protein
MRKEKVNMKKANLFLRVAFVFLFGLCTFGFSIGIASAHCDTMAGPVIQDAKMALEKGDITPVLKWVKKDQEKRVREAFNSARAAKSPAVKEKAELHFFETLVRIHRAGEGAPFTGLKPGEAIEPIVASADKSLETGSADELAREVNDQVTAGIRKRFDRVIEKKKHADESVDAGRDYVAAYVEFTHYVEDLYQKAVSEGAHHGEMKGHKHGGTKKERPAPLHKH